MAAPRVRSDYDVLKQVAQSFQQQAQATAQTLQRVRSQKETLQGGDWIGQGATAFYNEMDSQVLPTLQRLQRALEESARITGQISQVMKQAEDDAANVLKGNGSGGSGGAAAAGVFMPGGAVLGAAVSGGGSSAGGSPAGGGGGAPGGGAAPGGAGTPGGAGGAPAGTPTTRMLSQLDPQVAALAGQTPTLTSQLQGLEQDGWTVVKGPASGGSFTDRQNKQIVIAGGDTPEATLANLAHEMGHAEAGAPPYHPPTPGMTRDEFVEQNVQEQLRNEGEAQLNAAIARDEIRQAGGPDTGIPGTQTAAYQALYDGYKTGALSRQQTVNLMASVMASESTSTTNQNYRTYYGQSYKDFWDKNVAPAGGTP
jgi:WXG100 family type VII secretion target